jgi:hypothetical protein
MLLGAKSLLFSPRFGFVFQATFYKNLIFLIIISYIFLNHFDILISKQYFKIKKYYLNVFFNKKTH